MVRATRIVYASLHHTPYSISDCNTFICANTVVCVCFFPVHRISNVDDIYLRQAHQHFLQLYVIVICNVCQSFSDHVGMCECMCVYVSLLCVSARLLIRQKAFCRTEYSYTSHMLRVYIVADVYAWHLSIAFHFTFQLMYLI